LGLKSIHLLFCAFILLLAPHLHGSSFDLDASASPRQDPASDGDPIYKIGQGVSAPKLIFSVEPKPIQKSKEIWLVLISLVVDKNGSPDNISVLRVLDKDSAVIQDPGGDSIWKDRTQSAIEAVKQYRFSPGKKDGKPVKVALVISINFQPS
jgi:hypothetical protein